MTKNCCRKTNRKRISLILFPSSFVFIFFLHLKRSIILLLYGIQNWLFKLIKLPAFTLVKAIQLSAVFNCKFKFATHFQQQIKVRLDEIKKQFKTLPKKRIMDSQGISRLQSCSLLHIIVSPEFTKYCTFLQIFSF